MSTLVSEDILIDPLASEVSRLQAREAQLLEHVGRLVTSNAALKARELYLAARVNRLVRSASIADVEWRPGR